jgi:hypothetical protein
MIVVPSLEVSPNTPRPRGSSLRVLNCASMLSRDPREYPLQSFMNRGICKASPRGVAFRKCMPVTRPGSAR